MGSQLLTPNSEAAIWARLMQAHKSQLSAEAAEYLLAVDFDKSDQQRMLQLAERSEAGTLTDEERAEFDGYLHVGNLLAVMRSKARLVLKTKP
jgi:hypothetical protein